MVPAGLAALDLPCEAALDLPYDAYPANTGIIPPFGGPVGERVFEGGEERG